MRKRSDEAREEKRRRRGQEAAEGLTFLEKLVRNVRRTRQVPEESGVRFAISSDAKKDGICLVSCVDDREAPIFEEGALRPDYLVVHASKEGCILTIVEMKGREEKNVEHGIEQIRVMARRLRAELHACLPGSWRRAHIQGVLLMPQNAHVNWKKIQQARADVEIFPLGFHHQAELYPYVSKPISRTARYDHKPLRRDSPELNPLEQIVAEGRLERRVRDAFFTERRGADEDTFFLSFRRPADPKGAYLSVSATTRDAIVAFSEVATGAQKEVEAHLEKHGLRCPALRTQMLGV